MPIRATELPSHDESWNALSSFLEEWQETRNLVASPSLVKWEVNNIISTHVKCTHDVHPGGRVASFRARQECCTSLSQVTHPGKSRLYTAYTPRLTTSPDTVLRQEHRPRGIFADVASRTLLRGDDRISLRIHTTRSGEQRAPYTTSVDARNYRAEDYQGSLSHVHATLCILNNQPQLMTPHVRSSWYNPPRRRRHLMKEVLQWHMLHEVLLDEVEQRQPDVSAHPSSSQTFLYDKFIKNTATAMILSAITLAAQLGRLSACREVIISGFQQELYAPEEKPIAYWYLSRVLDAHMNCIENLLPLVPPGTTSVAFPTRRADEQSTDSTAYRELRFQAAHLSALQMISTTLVVVSNRLCCTLLQRSDLVRSSRPAT